jgi:predicted nucleic acid-binding protein
MAARRGRGRPGDLRDSMLAGIVICTGATLATVTFLMFDGLSSSAINPWQT